MEGGARTGTSQEAVTCTSKDSRRSENVEAHSLACTGAADGQQLWLGVESDRVHAVPQ